MIEVVSAQTERIAAYYIPVGEHAQEAQERAMLFQANGHAYHNLGIQLHKTEADLASMMDSLQEHVDETTSVMLFAGDGSANNLLHAMWKLKWNNPVTMGLGGNANDLAHQLHTARKLKQPERIFVDGWNRPLHLLNITAKLPGTDEPEETVAAGYWGAGVSADGVRQITTPEFRNAVKDLPPMSRFIREASVIYSTLRHASHMTLCEGNHSHPVQVVEFNVLNGSREAKTLHIPTMSLLRPEARATMVKNPNVRSMIMGLARAALHPVARIEADNSVTYMLESEEGILTQADGECKPYPSGTEFTFSLADSPLTIVTTR